MTNKKRDRARCLTIVQFEKNSKTGESLNFNEEVIKQGIAKRKDLLEWAYILHDKDKYVETDDIPKDKKIGDAKEPHWHIVLKFKNQKEFSSVAKDFNVPTNLVKAKNGNKPFLDCVYYLTHESEKEKEEGKHIYERDEVKISDKLIWNKVDNHINNKRTSKLDMILAEMAKGMTSTEVYDYDKIFAVKNSRHIDVARNKYLERASVPSKRMNIFLTGESGKGKTTSARVLARALYPHEKDDEKIFFMISDKKVAFDKYDGQSIIIWDEVRGETLLKNFDRGLLWNLFAVNPLKTTVNVKFGSKNLINVINIFTTIEDYFYFNDFLANGQISKKSNNDFSEDKIQAYRRFPFFINVTAERLTLNKISSLDENGIKTIKKIMSFKNEMLKLEKLQEKGYNVEVAEKLSIPISKIREVFESFQSNVEDDINIDDINLDIEIDE